MKKVITKNKVLKIQILDGIQEHKKANEKECFRTFHAWTHKQKAQALEDVISRPHTKFRIMFTDETPKAGEWYEEITA